MNRQTSRPPRAAPADAADAITTRVVTKPGAAFEVVELQLPPALRDALTTTVVRLPKRR